MAKRFTDSEKFRDPWYRKLKPKHKCMWEYFLSECDIAGILELDLDAMSFHIGDNITESDLELFSDRIYLLSENIIFIPKFITFQQKELSRANKSHINIYSALEKYSIPENLDMTNFPRGFQGASKGLPSPTSNSISNSIGISNGNSKSKDDNYENEFEIFWEAWTPYDMPKGTKKTAKDKFIKIRKSGVELETLLSSAKTYCDMSSYNRSKTKHMVTWLNQEGWKDENILYKGETNGKSSIKQQADELLESIRNGEINQNIDYNF